MAELSGGDVLISFGKDGKFSRTTLRNDTVLAQHLYRSVKLRSETPRCLCVPDGLEMVIAVSSSGTHMLRRWPGFGDAHAPYCWSSGVIHKTRGKPSYISCIVRRRGKPTEFSLSSPIMIAQERHSPPRSSTPGPASTVRRAAGFKQLFYFLWEEIGMTQWKPDDEPWGYTDIHVALGEKGREILCNNVFLRDILLMPGRTQGKDAFDLEAKRCTDLVPPAPPKRRALVLGLIDSLEPARFGHCLSLYLASHTALYIQDSSLTSRLLRTLPKSEDGYYRLKDRKTREFSHWFIGTAFPKERKDRLGFSMLIDAGRVIRTTRHHIPLG